MFYSLTSIGVTIKEFKAEYAKTFLNQYLKR